MATFAVMLEDGPQVIDYLNSVKERLGGDNLVKNPFTGYVYHFAVGEDKRLAAVCMKPIYFNVSVFGWIIAIASFIGFGWLPWLQIPAIGLGLTGWFWLSPFYKLTFKMGLKKNEYDGSVEFLSSSVALGAMAKFMENTLKGDAVGTGGDP